MWLKWNVFSSFKIKVTWWSLKTGWSIPFPPHQQFLTFLIVEMGWYYTAPRVVMRSKWCVNWKIVWYNITCPMYINPAQNTHLLIQDWLMWEGSWMGMRPVILILLFFFLTTSFIFIYKSNPIEWQWSDIWSNSNQCIYCAHFFLDTYFNS